MKKLKTNPSNFLDFVLWPLLRILWEPLSRKRSHWWHWIKLPQDELSIQSIRIKGNCTAKNRDSAWRNFWQTNIGWKRAVIVRPNTEREYRIGYIDADKTELCSIILKGPVALLKGPKEISVFALSHPEQQNLNLSVAIGDIHKQLVDKKIPIL